MSLQFIYGRSGSGKSFHCLKSIKTKQNKDNSKKLVLLVPEQYTLQAERDLIKVLGTGGILNTEVLSFRRMAYRVMNEVGGITYPHIHPAGKSMIIYRILDRLKEQFTIFHKSANCKGFVNTLSTLITELKRYNVRADSFDEVLEGLTEDNYLLHKLKEIKLIYSEFDNMLESRYRDTDDELTLLASKLDSTEMYSKAEIWIDGFAGFTPQEVEVISKLIQQTENVYITMCTDVLFDEMQSGSTDVFAAVKKSCKKFVSIAEASDVKILPPVGLNSANLPRFKESRELQSQEANYFAYPYRVYQQPTTDIELFESVNIYAEIEECARDIIRQCRDNDMQFKDITVATRNLTGYENLIEVIFEQYNIPCFIDSKTEITNHPLVRMVLSMLEIFTENWSYEAVFRYLKSGLTGIEDTRIDLLENYVLACGIRGSRWTQEAEWNTSIEFRPDDKQSPENDEMLLQVNVTRNEVREPLLRFRNRTKGRRTAEDFCTGIYEYLVEIGVEERIRDYIDSFTQNGQLRLAGEYQQVWNILMDVFDQVVEVMGDETFGIEKFANVFKIGLAEYKISSIPASLDQVLIGSIEHLRSHEIKALYILGTNDGVFPSAGISEGVLSDKDRDVLNKKGIELASDTKSKAFDELYLIYRTLTMPKNFLRISWPIADHEGRTMRPSTIISRMRKIFPNITEKNNILKPAGVNNNIDLIASPVPSFNQLVSILRQKNEGIEPGHMWKELFAWFSAQEEWKQKCDAMINALKYRNIAVPVDKAKIRELYGKNPYFTVSRLEKYTSCPFAFYVQYGLGARERKIYRLSPPDVGTFMHAVIERFSKMVDENNYSWREIDRQWCSDEVSKIVDELLASMKNTILGGSKRFKALAVRLKRVVTRAVWLIAEHIRRSSFEPVGYEVEFGEGGAYPPIVIELDSGEKIKLVGRIDRIDTLSTDNGKYLRIVDYKSGDKDFKLSDVYYGLQMQLITYLDALWESSENSGEKALPGGILYFRVDDPMIKGTGSSSPEEIETAIMKKLKMKGLLLADVQLIKYMDNTIEGNSIIIPARINKGDVLGKSSAATIEQFTVLRSFVKQILKDMCSELMKGKVPISPYKKKKLTSCSYCNYSSVCQFDQTQKDNSFRMLHDRDDDHIWKLMDGNNLKDN
ncbi:ATP-dependent nuclease subunit B [Ruminiclostridium papyrosolvens DSM 2782]|uniref:ATP-dependent helicase/deoxyribonuclease subunit B n=1 Tax=Ruminiclostridium papyrosolvens DSM 2782 TaxID=588581 RepID=F1T9V9_9FIRM|nr:helicase-exonuclease AddAB subunit AddB [Ruminiclostridium papyrosolvens]EGD48701.1 ATP-dependent nuclease subunit B [Ruminiclostridium papyrosolvens DSM 2782]WES32542.1 helicase-exonuclease AddAB subunit AddB [Ruminiclostridium papyrosolvens DSM 2782]